MIDIYTYLGQNSRLGQTFLQIIWHTLIAVWKSTHKHLNRNFVWNQCLFYKLCTKCGRGRMIGLKPNACRCRKKGPNVKSETRLAPRNPPICLFFQGLFSRSCWSLMPDQKEEGRKHDWHHIHSTARFLLWCQHCQHHHHQRKSAINLASEGPLTTF